MRVFAYFYASRGGMRLRGVLGYRSWRGEVRELQFPGRQLQISDK